MSKVIRFLIALLFVGLSNQWAQAESLRCGTNLVQIGDNKAELIEKCGPPTATDSYCRNEYIQGNFGVEAICRQVDVWTYNLGFGTFLMHVEFEEGKISRITHGDRVD